MDFDEVTRTCHNQAEAIFLKDAMQHPALPIAPPTGGHARPEDRIPPGLGWFGAIEGKLKLGSYQDQPQRTAVCDCEAIIGCASQRRGMYPKV